MKKNKCLNKNDNKQDTNIADNYNKSFVHNLKSEYIKKQNTVTVDSKTYFITFF